MMELNWQSVKLHSKSRRGSCIKRGREKSCTESCIKRDREKNCTESCIKRDREKSCTESCFKGDRAGSHTENCWERSSRKADWQKRKTSASKKQSAKTTKTGTTSSAKKTTTAETSKSNFAIFCCKWIFYTFGGVRKWQLIKIRRKICHALHEAYPATRMLMDSWIFLFLRIVYIMIMWVGKSTYNYDVIKWKDGS